jgi:hypothetical protein
MNLNKKWANIFTMLAKSIALLQIADSVSKDSFKHWFNKRKCHLISILLMESL